MSWTPRVLAVPLELERGVGRTAVTNHVKQASLLNMYGVLGHSNNETICQDPGTTCLTLCLRL